MYCLIVRMVDSLDIDTSLYMLTFYSWRSENSIHCGSSNFGKLLLSSLSASVRIDFGKSYSSLKGIGFLSACVSAKNCFTNSSYSASGNPSHSVSSAVISSFSLIYSFAMSEFFLSIFFCLSAFSAALFFLFKSI